MAWSKKHGDILQTFFQELDKENIRFFIIRNFEGLPANNPSKDVDIILKHGTAFAAEKILIKVFKQFNLTHYYRVQIEESLLCRAIDINNEFAIHIDLMNGYINRGVELFSFEELYNQTIDYNGFKVLNKLYDGIMLFVYKQFGYKRPVLKQSYQDTIYKTWEKYPEFSSILNNLLGSDLFNTISQCIKNKDFDKMLTYSPDVNKKLRTYSNKQHRIINYYRKFKFIGQKVNRILLNYRKYEKSISVMAPDGAGKTTFLMSLLEMLAFYYVDATKDISRFHIYHFRPTLLPNLGEIGEKAKVKKQDIDFTNPHRAKPAGFFSSIIRITYYWLDYVLGWMLYTRKDVQYDFYTVYDRYSYDLIVDPGRTRLNIPMWIRKLYVSCMPHPKLNFFLNADPNIIIKRKAELTLPEIERQIQAFQELCKNNSNIIILNANLTTPEIVNEAIKHVINKYWTKLA